MPNLKAVTLLRTAPPLTDIAGQLRALATRIENGDEDAVRACYVLLDTDSECRPRFFGWGQVADRHGLAGLFMHAAQLALLDRDD